MTTAALPDATAGRIDYLKKTSLHPEGMEWYQRPLMQPPDLGRGTGDIARGFDFLTTLVAFQRLQVPASMLGPGMEPFDELVEFRGAPLADNIGTADTIMERLEDATFGKEVVTQLVGFGNVSARPITLRGSGQMAGDYHLFVTLSPTAPSFGRATYHSDDGGLSGWVDSEVSLAPLFELRPVGGGTSVYVDTGVMPMPGFPMGLTSDSSRWTRASSKIGAPAWEGEGESLHFPDMVLIVAKDQGIADKRELDHIRSVLQAYLLPEGHPDRVTDIGRALPNLTSCCGKAT